MNTFLLYWYQLISVVVLFIIITEWCSFNDENWSDASLKQNTNLDKENLSWLFTPEASSTCRFLQLTCKINLMGSEKGQCIMQVMTVLPSREMEMKRKHLGQLKY